MKLDEIETPVSSISGVGPSLAKTLTKLDIFTVSSLLSYWPRDWEDRTKKIPLSSWKSYPKVHTIAQVTAHEWFGYGRMKTLRIHIDDGTTQASLVCFNRPFLEKMLPVGSVISLTAPFSYKFGELQSTSFEAECLAKDASIDDYKEASVPGSTVLPIYALTAGITQNQLRKIITKALKEYDRGIENELPESVIKKRNLLPKQLAIFAMHKPLSLQQALDAKRTLAYEELYKFQLTILKRAKNRKKPIKTTTNNVTFESSLSPRQRFFLERLTFELTPDQKKVILEMNTDMDLSQMPPYSQMARLLQGDVGSGKTMVAFFAALRIIDYGGQCAFMAPTEILARQHAENAAKTLEPLNVKIAFLTGNIQASGRKQLLSALKAGDIDIVIGTHALFSQAVQYYNLRFAVIDEQHRFGVVQRNAILDKGRTSILQQKNQQQGANPIPPDFLLMSATPIPQTLALTIFGDLDVSTIKTMPQGRLPIQTHLTREGNESRVYEAVRAELKQGHQAYFVYPLIENPDNPNKDDEYLNNFTKSFENDNNNKPLKSAEEMFTFLSEQVFPEYKCALVHSRVDEAAQSKALEAFRTGDVQILVATSVVEVGVDVPNATCMVIEHAERFGLSALHQLRGRVGRGIAQSQCFLIYSEKLTEIGKSRLKVLHSSNDGFYIAEEDLKLRGPGDMSGIQQSGYFTLGISDPIKDKELLQLARVDALELLQQNDC